MHCMCIIFLFTNICSPHQLFLQILYERVFLASYYKLSVPCFAHRYGHILVAAFVTSVYGYKEIVAAAVYLDAYLCTVAYHQRTGAQAVWGNGGEHEHIGIGGDDSKK